MVTYLECCLSNCDRAARQLFAERGHDLRVKPCLQRCGTCYDGTFVVADGDLLTGESHRAILAELETDG